jgi:Spy/CpxP family protein refolding chaperone
MELSKAVAGAALLIIVLLALGHASEQTKSRETPKAEESQSAPHSGAQGEAAPDHG